MSHGLEELDKRRPVDAADLAEAKEAMLRYERAWQLRELRERARLTQTQLAAQMGVGQNRVSQIESGGAERIRLDTLRRYASALGGVLRVEISVGGRRFLLT